MNPGIATNPEIEDLVRCGAPVAIGVSGGKDSCGMAFATREYLDSVGHMGSRILIHSDLGRTEWKDSLPTCQRLAEATGMELVVVRRKAGDMLARWQTRWANNVERYLSLSCVKLILPWSTPEMRFCTSELKMDVIFAELTHRFRSQNIVSASGIRADESRTRARAPISKRQPKLCRSSRNTLGWDWHPILHWRLEDVLDRCRLEDFPLHEAYGRFGSSRVSCCFCILGSQRDLLAAAGCADNHELYREMVALEASSTFAFQSNNWLGDIATHLLSEELQARLRNAKLAAKTRELAESAIPKHLLYTKGWPTCVPTLSEAKLLGSVRSKVAAVVGLEPTFIDPIQIITRYQELMAAKDAA